MESSFTGDMFSSAASGGSDSGESSSSVSATPDASPTSVSDATPTNAGTAPITPSSGLAGDGDHAGPLPFERHKAILERQRQESAKQVADLEAQFGPVKEWHQRFQSDPAAFAEQLIDELSSDPRYAQSLRSRAGKILSAARRVAAEQASPQQESEPQPDYVNPSTGEAFYSATQQKALLAWQQTQMEQKIMAQIAPLQQDAHQRQATQQFESMKAQAWSSAQSTLKEWEAMPGFTEHKAEIRKAFSEMGPKADLGKAYAKVVGPRLVGDGRAQALADLRSKATASDRNPNAATVSQSGKSGRPGSFSSPEGLAMLRDALSR